MIISLRVLRALFGLVFILSVMNWVSPRGLILLVTTMASGNWYLITLRGFVYFFVPIISGGLVYYLRKVINRIHTKKYGIPHPAMVNPYNV